VGKETEGVGFCHILQAKPEKKAKDRLPKSLSVCLWVTENENRLSL